MPVALVALAAGPAWGAAAGVAATGFYTAGIIINPHLASSQVLTAGSIVRLITYTSMGALVGWFASHHRDLSDRLRIASERDHLTGLLNTRAFDAALTARLEQRRPFGLILADMDNMKDVNDSEGHAVGNDVLRLAGEVLARDREPGDDVARIGGDEFAVITNLPGSETVRALCSRLTAELADGGHQHELRLGRVPARRRDVSAALPRRRRAALRAEADSEPPDQRGNRRDAVAGRATGTPLPHGLAT